MPHWLDVGLMFAIQGACALGCLFFARMSLGLAPPKFWMRPLKWLAAILPIGITASAISISKGLTAWLVASPVVLLVAAVWLGWGYWLSPRLESNPVAPELNLVGCAALAGAAVEPAQGFIRHMAGQPGDGAIGNWVYLLFIPLWALFGLIPGGLIALFAWWRDWRGEGDGRWV